MGSALSLALYILFCIVALLSMARRYRHAYRTSRVWNSTAASSSVKACGEGYAATPFQGISLFISPGDADWRQDRGMGWRVWVRHNRSWSTEEENNTARRQHRIDKQADKTNSSQDLRAFRHRCEMGFILTSVPVARRESVNLEDMPFCIHTSLWILGGSDAAWRCDRVPICLPPW